MEEVVPLLISYVIVMLIMTVLVLCYLVWASIVIQLPVELYGRAKRAETAKKIWDEVDRTGCSLADLPDIKCFGKMPVSAVQAVRWAGKSNLRAGLGYRKLRKAEESLRRAQQMALQREMKVRSRTI